MEGRSIGKRIKEVRERIGWSQRRLAGHLQATPQDVDDFEHDCPDSLAEFQIERIRQLERIVPDLFVGETLPESKKP